MARINNFVILMGEAQHCRFMAVETSHQFFYDRLRKTSALLSKRCCNTSNSVQQLIQPERNQVDCHSRSFGMPVSLSMRSARVRALDSVEAVDSSVKDRNF